MYPLGEVGAQGGTVLSNAAEYFQEKWAAFVGLTPAIIDLQHRASLARQRYNEEGKTTEADAARAVIVELGKLNVTHGKIVDHFSELAPYVGLGAVAVPVAIAAAFSTAAIAMLWFFRKMGVQEKALGLLEAGVLTEAGFLEMNRELGASPIRETLGFAKLALWGFLGWMGFKVFSELQGPRSNPPLVIFGNPPDVLSEDVVSIQYVHAEDGELYQHDFEGDVRGQVLADGGFLISHPTRPVWRDF